jgi:hypothetical protein
MLLKIDGKNDNPTQTLILALQARGSKMTKDEDFYLAFMDGNVRPTHLSTTRKPDEVGYQESSKDPFWGS